MLIKNILIPIILCFFILDLSAQDSLSTNMDSIPNTISKIDKKKKKKSLKQFFKEDYPKPKKAVLLAIIPGMGQIYNKKYWKLPLVYGALGGVIYSIKYNTDQYNIYQNEINCRSEDSVPNCNITLSDAAVQSLRNNFDKNRQLSWIGLIGFYLISAGDALVDAHLKNFNVNDDISLLPILETDYYNHPLIGIGVQISLTK